MSLSAQRTARIRRESALAVVVACRIVNDRALRSAMRLRMPALASTLLDIAEDSGNAVRCSLPEDLVNDRPDGVEFDPVLIAKRVDSAPKYTITGRPSESGGSIKSPLSIASPRIESALDARGEEIGRLIYGGSGEDRIVKLADLVTIQDQVSAERVKEIARAVARGKEFSFNELPIVIEFEGEMILWDGNHRAVAASLGGGRSLRARVIRL